MCVEIGVGLLRFASLPPNHDLIALDVPFGIPEELRLQ